MNKKNIKSAFESMMFIWGEPLSAKEAGNVLGIDSDEALEIMRELAEEYGLTSSGIRAMLSRARKILREKLND